MGKKKQRHLPSPGPSTHAVDLFLLAGLPNPLHAGVEKFLQDLARPAAKVIASSSPSFDG